MTRCSDRAYATLSGSQALRLSRLSRQALDNKQGPQIQCSLRKAIRKSNASNNPKKKVQYSDLDSGSNTQALYESPKTRSPHKRKRHNPPGSDKRLSDDCVSDAIESDTDSNVDWSMNLGRTSSRLKKKHRQDVGTHHHLVPKRAGVDNIEVIELSSD